MKIDSECDACLGSNKPSIDLKKPMVKCKKCRHSIHPVRLFLLKNDKDCFTLFYGFKDPPQKWRCDLCSVLHKHPTMPID